MKKIVLSTLVIGVAGVVGFVAIDTLAEEKLAQLQLVITPGELTIGIGDNAGTVTLTVGTTPVSFSERTLTGTFTDKFWVEDLKGSGSGYTTTLQSSNLTGNVEGTVYSIPAANVKLTVSGAPKIEGEDNSEVRASAAGVSLSTAQTFIYREKPSTAGILGKYGTGPTISVTVPANYPAATYVGTLTYTLIDNG